MTRINCIPPKLLLDEHLRAHCREGLRPINEVKAGKSSIAGCPNDWRLGTGHVKFCKKHLLFTAAQFDSAAQENESRGFGGYTYRSDLSGIPFTYLNDYTPTKKALRSNLARICVRWRKRTKPYHYDGERIDDLTSFKQYVQFVKRELSL